MGQPVFRTAANLSLILSPLLIVQGRRVRRTIQRLPDASGPRAGACPGDSPRLRLLLIGDSTVAGVGAPDLSAALAGQLVRAVAERTGRSVVWQVMGRTGATARAARLMFLETQLDQAPDVVVLAVGANDALQLRSARAWRKDLGDLIGSVRARCGPVPVVVSGLPPIDRFPVLPQPLRAVLGMRAKLLDQTSTKLSRELTGVHHAPGPVIPRGEESPLFCADGLHPSPLGYTRWAEELGAVVASACDRSRDEA